MDRVTKTLVETAVVSLNDKAEELGMARRFEFRPGSRSNGVAYSLAESQDQAWVAETKIGRSLAEAYDYVLAMNHAFTSIISDRNHRRVSRHALPTYAEVNRTADFEDAMARPAGADQ
jgi:hypothetical protein